MNENEKHVSCLNHGADIEAMLQEIAYYIQTSQPPGFPQPNRSDALRYAITRAAGEIRNERASQNMTFGAE